jgi:hypothetical protein
MTDKKDIEDEEDAIDTRGATVGLGDQEIPLSSLNVQQLSQLSQQLQVEVQGLNRSLQGLQDGSMRFGQSSECLEQLQEHIKDNETGEKQKNVSAVKPKRLC